MKLSKYFSRVVNMARGKILSAGAGTAIALVSGFGMPTLASAQVVSVGHYTWEGNGTVNTHWIETPNGVIVIDVQRDLPHAREAIQAIEKIGKPVKAIFVTHGHPDHYAGLGVFRERWPSLDIYASRETADVIKNDRYGFHAVAQKMMPGEFPDRFPEVTKVFKSDTDFVIDGARIQAREMGRAEANSATVLYLPQTGDLYTGDLVLTRMHAFFYEESSRPWLGVLDRLQKSFPLAKTVWPGHGEPMPAKRAIAEQREYITFSRNAVIESLRKLPPTLPQTAGDAELKIKTRFPNYGLPAGRFTLDEHVRLNVQWLTQEFARDGAQRAVR